MRRLGVSRFPGPRRSRRKRGKGNSLPPDRPLTVKNVNNVGSKSIVVLTVASEQDNYMCKLGMGRNAAAWLHQLALARKATRLRLEALKEPVALKVTRGKVKSKSKTKEPQQMPRKRGRPRKDRSLELIKPKPTRTPKPAKPKVELNELTSKNAVQRFRASLKGRLMAAKKKLAELEVSIFKDRHLLEAFYLERQLTEVTYFKHETALYALKNGLDLNKLEEQLALDFRHARRQPHDDPKVRLARKAKQDRKHSKKRRLKVKAEEKLVFDKVLALAKEEEARKIGNPTVKIPIIQLD